MRKATGTALLTALLIAGCGGNNSEEVTLENLDSSVDDRLELDSYIPEIEGYPVGLATVESKTELNEDGEEVVTDEPRQAIVTYYQSMEEPIEDLDVDQWEKDNNSEVIYGDFYNDMTLASLSITPESAGTMQEAEEIEIEGHPVQYMHSEEADAVFMHFDVNDAGYIVTYYLLDDRTEEDAINFAGEIISHYTES
ncbi:hypothetical protein [Jeotgalibacillus sp. R-1-5s-1]|uniref:hypothetical protein n=1 Tax=Jeotgalibacillus sp. R-1-5s-1 TaxID=2555897 RepID=UPI00106B947B|nr:hypothetical protein [Jeotgalibacillus sp. R-1-5s-1]TFD97083.1 hypothetical protein E2491_10355 [Jeotgalibacillus sp. R-1-5s-1]